MVTLKSSIFGLLTNLNEIQLIKRISICDSLLKRNETDAFLKRIITDDEKWVVYEGIVYFKLLPRNQTINSNVYYHQLIKLDKEIKEKRSELATRRRSTFHQDNVRPHTSSVTRKTLLELDWEVMPHLPYSPDLAPSDYHLFPSLQNNLNGKTFDSNEAVKNKLIQVLASKNQTFYGSGIMKLTERWQKVIEQNGQYIIVKCLLFILINLL